MLALGKYFQKKKEEFNSKEEFFDKVLKEAKHDLVQSEGKLKPTNLRELVQQKASLRWSKSQTANLKSAVVDIVLENRAKSNKVVYFFFRTVHSIWFQRFITLTIIANTIDLSLYRYPI